MGRTAPPSTGGKQPEAHSADGHQASQPDGGQQPPAAPGPAAAGPPQRKLGELTTSELNTRRREVEHAITHISVTAPIQHDLRRWLDDVAAEEHSRAQIAAANGKAAPCASRT